MRLLSVMWRVNQYKLHVPAMHFHRTKLVLGVRANTAAMLPFLFMTKCIRCVQQLPISLTAAFGDSASC